MCCKSERCSSSSPDNCYIKWLQLIGFNANLWGRWRCHQPQASEFLIYWTEFYRRNKQKLPAHKPNHKTLISSFIKFCLLIFFRLTASISKKQEKRNQKHNSRLNVYISKTFASLIQPETVFLKTWCWRKAMHDKNNIHLSKH
jgi:hypothetical protein